MDRKLSLPFRVAISDLGVDIHTGLERIKKQRIILTYSPNMTVEERRLFIIQGIKKHLYSGSINQDIV